MDRRSKAIEILKAGTVIPATPLALTAERKFDEASQRRLTRYYLEAGAGGIATAVHSTQFEIRDPKINLFETVIKTVSSVIDSFEAQTGKTVVKVCGVCGVTKQAVYEAQLAKECGYDAVLLSPGGLGDFDEEYMIERTKAVAAVMPVIGFYLQPSVGGRIFTYSYWERLCEIEGVVAIKCAPFNRYLTHDVVRAATLSSRAEDITLYTGNDDNIVVDLLTEYRFIKDGKTVTGRFSGGLLGHWCVWTRRVVEMFPMLRGAEPSVELLSLAAEITDANAAIFDAAHNFAGCIPGIHEILRRQGLLGGIWCLNPDEVLSDGQAEEIERVCKAYPHLCDDKFVAEFLSNYKE